MSEVEGFILKHDGKQLQLLRYFHHLLTDDLGLDPRIRFGLPFYYRHSWICYLNPLKNRTVEFAFTRGNELSNEQGLLQSKGRKQVFSIEFKSVQDLPSQSLYEVIQEAILLDESVPYESKNRKK